MTTPQITVKRLPIVNRWDEAKLHLDMIAGTVLADLAPLLQTAGGAPHTIAREVFCYVDYLGALYVGTSGMPLGPDGLAQVKARFTKYLEDIMGLVDTGYKHMAETLYQMYRNGTVHQFDPKALNNKAGELLSWMAYRGQRTEPDLFPFPIQHLQKTQHPQRLVAGGNIPLYVLPVSTACLIEDLLASIELFKLGLGNLQQSIAKWNETAALLNTPAQFEFP